MATQEKKREDTAKRKKSDELKDSTIPDVIYAQASPRSIGDVSMFEAQAQINSETVINFVSEADTIRRAASQLEEAGFQILNITQTTINIAGSRETDERAFKTNIVAEERFAIKELGKETTATFLDSSDTGISGLISTEGTPFKAAIEGVALEEPRYFMAPSMFAPMKSYWHLRVPGDVSLADNADKAHRTGITGRGVKVAMVDSGHFRHPYFVGRGYRVAPVVLGPGAANPLADEVGHGTGESANIFANAPDVDFLPVKMNFVNTIAAFNAAVGLHPNIITCSWGSDKPFGPLSAADQALAVAIAAAVAAGIIVIFSAGNGQAGFPGQHPDVISAGGVFMNPDETLQASNYASGFMSNIYPGRRVPDLCGLVGMKPKAIYIMLPLEPRDQIDIDLSGGTYPNGDETANTDGWAAFSGTSAAAPQLAGVAALIKQACPGLTPAQVRDIMKTTAHDVTTGSCNAVHLIHTGLPAAVGPDTATGNGLVDAQKAVLVAKLRCLGPIRPPGPPIIPPGPPIIPPGPPIIPPRPPIIPPRPPIIPPGPTPSPQGTESMGAALQQGMGQPIGAPQLPVGEQPSGQLSAEDVKALEDMVAQGEIDLDI